MARLRFLFVGKKSRGWEEEGAQEYLKRLPGHWKIEMEHLKTDADLILRLQGEKGIIFLDPEGEEMDSPTFSKVLTQELERQGGYLTFVVGGAEGIPSQLFSLGRKISFSKMVFPHQLFRLLLLEQIYRAQEIDKGSQYHK